MNQPNAAGIHRVMHEIKRRRLHVLRVTDLTPKMRRITLGGPELAGFISLGADDHIKLFFAQTPEQQAVLESMKFGGDSEGPKPAMRDYTPRRYDAASGELDIDFVLHGDGPASTWAEQAQPGQYLFMGGPRGSMIVPDMFESYLLIGDETAQPSIARRLEELPAGRNALALIEVANAEEQQQLRSAASVEVQWVRRDKGESLLSAVKKITLPSGSLYTWIATESAASRRVRRVLLDDFGVDENFLKAAGYWKLDSTTED